MMHVSKNSLYVTLGFAVLSLPVPAYAGEGLLPLQPGATTGSPLGALPPPGVYVNLDLEYGGGRLRDTNGRSVPVKINDNFDTVSALWSTPYKILGAQYAAGVIVPFSYYNVDTRGVGGRNTSNVGFFNPVFTPAVLSWSLPSGFHVSAGVSFYPPIGAFHVANKTRLQTSYANGYFTFEPNVAVSYLANGWDLTASNFYDINAKNTHTNYKSGSTYYLELTATKTFGKFAAGLIGNYTRQIGDDRKAGVVVGDGNKVEHVLVGPYLSYAFDRFTLIGRALQDVYARNDIQVTFVHLGVSTKF